jgi:hypothetical protein
VKGLSLTVALSKRAADTPRNKILPSHLKVFVSWGVIFLRGVFFDSNPKGNCIANDASLDEGRKN